ncbi:TPA_asm: L [Argyranthemum gammacytorhabdovirus 1]|nr:TPA_asm: L [Argyranthemum gammacytorhabdovirus 1]
MAFSTFDGDFSGSEYQGLRDYHLRSALTSACLSSSLIPDHEVKLKKEVKILEQNFKVVERDPGAILGLIFNQSMLMTLHGQEFHMAGRCLRTEGSIYPSLPCELFKDASKMLTEETMRTKYYAPCSFFQRAVVCSNAKNAQKDLPREIIPSNADLILDIITLTLPGSDIILKVGSECFGVMISDNCLSIHSLEHLRNWSDKCTERFNIELACIFGNKLNPHIYPPINLIYHFWSIWDEDLERLGNKMFKLIKIFEAMVIGEILEKNPNSVIQPMSNFKFTILNDFMEGLTHEDFDLRDPAIKMRVFLENMDSMQYLSQIYGLYRSWGHPIVSSVAGIKKVMQLGKADKFVSEILPMQVRRIFMTKYSEWHKRTKGCYPEIGSYVEGESGNSVYEILVTNGPVTSLIRLMLSSDWDDLRFSKNIEVPQTFNLSEMVADKAVSPDRDGLARILRRNKSMYDANLRRGVLQWLMRAPEKCLDFLQRVNDQSLRDNECIIGLYQKEREVNVTPRMFALMSHSIRNYIVTTESMLSDDILPAFPSITMTNSLLSLQKKIYSVSHKQAQNSNSRGFQTYKDVTIIVNIDFEKWNLNFRKETTFPLFEAIGDLYGMENLYNRTYDIFQNSLIYLADGVFRPQLSNDRNRFLLEEPMLYTGHLGGFEGLRQKGWTLFTDCGLELICNRHKCSYVIMGQGDNQVLTLTWKTYMIDHERNVTDIGKERLSEQFRFFMHDLVQTFGSLGLPVKALETWTSENLFLYGKFPTLRGVPLAMSLKKICRAYYLANEEIMTLDCALATIQSNAMAACMSDVTSYVPYVIYKIQVFIALYAYSKYHVLLGGPAFNFQADEKWKFTTTLGTRWQYEIGRIESKWRLMVLFSWFPKILGGLNTASWFDFMMRGFPDKVCSALTWIRLIMNVETDDIIRKNLRKIYECHINEEKNFILLIEDPCALNLVVPVDARSAMKQAVADLFEGLQGVRNVEFASLFKTSKQWDRSTFCESLCKGDILHPRLLHDLAAATPSGYIDSVLAKVTKASTINKTALRSSSNNPGNKIETSEKNIMKYLLWKMNSHNVSKSNTFISCPTQQARTLRYLSWGKILEGVTVPHPLAFLEMKTCTQSPEETGKCDLNYISATLPESFCFGDLSVIHSLGRSPPYLGSETKEKIGADPERQVFGKEPLISRPLKLLRVINWFVPRDSHTGNLIATLLRSVSDLDPDIYISKEMGVTGSEAHRYRDQALKHGVMSANMYTLGSHMHISTDPWVKYTRGAENFTINYQAILCCIQSLLGQLIFIFSQNHEIPQREYHFHESCSSCIVNLTDEFHDLADDSSLSMIHRHPENQYLWITETALSFKYKHDPHLTLKIPEVSREMYRIIRDKRSILTHWISMDICNDIGQMISTSMVRLLDSKDYPRVMYKKLSVAELWNELAIELICEAGIRYTSGLGNRVTFIKSARELAADDLMKNSPSVMMGAAMFYTWPDKFTEIVMEYPDAIYPDTNPPSLMSACIAAQANIRELIRSVEFTEQKVLYLKRQDVLPIKAIKRFWYRKFVSLGKSCTQCLKMISNVELPNELVHVKTLKCGFNHITFDEDMCNILILTASDDRLVKDSFPFVSPEKIKFQNRVKVTDSPATCEWFDSMRPFIYSDQLIVDPPLLRKNFTWEYSCMLPTSTKARVLETLGLIRRDFSGIFCCNGFIIGDGLGESSKLLSLSYPHINWVVSSLQDSEQAIPQCYPHVLIPGNPSPESNLNYNITKFKFNDLNSDIYVQEWNQWVAGGICWFEAEIKGLQLTVLEKILSLSKWDLLIIRAEIEPSLISSCLKLLADHSDRVKSYLVGSFDICNYELLFICSNTEVKAKMDNTLISSSSIYNSLKDASENLYPKTGSLLYGEYLSALETKNEVAQMIKRCDYWFAAVGLTHFLSCGRLFTPIWWDLQTGLIPQWVKDLGENKTYYLYKSDLIALHARLISLAISMLKSSEEYLVERNRYKNWKMVLFLNEDRLDIRLRRGRAINYGPDEEYILKFLPILRKINYLNRRGWDSMPDEIMFSSTATNNTFGISRGSQLIPVNLPSIS